RTRRLRRRAHAGAAGAGRAAARGQRQELTARGEIALRFMTIVKGREGCLPSQELIERLMKLGEEATKQGVMVGMGGLGPTAQGARAHLSKSGKITVTDGPFT